MIKSNQCVNVSSKNPEQLVKFYNEKLGVPLTNPPENDYDGVSLGFIKGSPEITIWDENKWGKSSEGAINFVFTCDDIDKTYKELRTKGVKLDPPRTADWGGKELVFLDPDGNKIMVLL